MPMFLMFSLWEGILWVTKGNTNGRAVNTQSEALEAFTTFTGEGGRVWRQHTDLGRLFERPNTKVQYYVLVWCTVDSNGLSAPCSLHSNLIEKSPHHKHSLPQRPERSLLLSDFLWGSRSLPAGGISQISPENHNYFPNQQFLFSSHS